MFKYLRVFVVGVWSEWFTRISGSLTVPFTILSFLPFAWSAKVAFGVLAGVGLIVTFVTMWLREYRLAHKDTVTFRIMPFRWRVELYHYPGNDMLCLSLGMAVRFENRDTGQLLVRDLKVSLCRKDRFRVRQLSCLEAKRDIGELIGVEALLDEKTVMSWLDPTRGITIAPRSESPDYLLQTALQLPYTDRGQLDLRHFLRITMDAMNQEPITIDREVDWRSIKKQEILW